MIQHDSVLVSKWISNPRANNFMLLLNEIGLPVRTYKIDCTLIVIVFVFSLLVFLLENNLESNACFETLKNALHHKSKVFENILKITYVHCLFFRMWCNKNAFFESLLQKSVEEIFFPNFLLWIDTYYIHIKFCQRNSITFSSNSTFQIYFQNFSKTVKSQLFYSKKCDGFGGWKLFFQKLSKSIFSWTGPLRGSRYISQAPSSEI